MSHIDGTRKSYSSPYEITVCMTKEECKILLPFFQKKKVFSDKNNYLCTQGKQLLYYESYRGRLVFV